MPQITWGQLPKEIQEKMLEHQEKQTGKREPQYFINLISEGAPRGGITWEKTPEGYNFWSAIIAGKTDHFYRRYPKK